MSPRPSFLGSVGPFQGFDRLAALFRAAVMGEMLEDKKFDVEHALNLYADGFSLFRARAIYDEEALKPFMSVIECCHIYFIGKVPKVDFVGARQSDRTLFVSMKMLGKTYDLDWPLPDGMNLKEEDALWYLHDENGKRAFVTEDAMFQKLAQTHDCLRFDVQYKLLILVLPDLYQLTDHPRPCEPQLSRAGAWVWSTSKMCRTKQRPDCISRNSSPFPQAA